MPWRSPASAASPRPHQKSVAVALAPCAGLPERLEVSLAAAGGGKGGGGGQTLVLTRFSLQPQLEMDSALALLEHLAEEQG